MPRLPIQSDGQGFERPRAATSGRGRCSRIVVEWAETLAVGYGSIYGTMEGLGIATALLIVLGSVSILNGVRELARGFMSRSWPVTRGTILSASPAAGGLGRIAWRFPQIRFEYVVAGEKYVSDGYSASSQTVFLTQASLLRRLAAYAPGSHVDVYFDPGNPGRGILRPGVIPVISNLRYVLIGLVALYVGTVLHH